MASGFVGRSQKNVNRVGRPGLQYLYRVNRQRRLREGKTESVAFGGRADFLGDLLTAVIDRNTVLYPLDLADNVVLKRADRVPAFRAGSGSLTSGWVRSHRVRRGVQLRRVWC